MKRRKRIILILCWLRNIVLFFFALSLFFVLLYKYVPVYYTPHLFAKDMKQVFGNEDGTQIEHQWVALSDISPNLMNAVIASEDNLFLIHNGFDFSKSATNPGEISRSRYKWKTGTISQQTARNVFLFPTDNYLSRTLESYFTFLIEFVWGKERIMEVYLNSIEFGDGIFGAEAIARKNFQLHAKELGVSEAALITVSINNPRELDSSKPTTYMLRRQARIISIMDSMIPVEFGK